MPDWLHTETLYESAVVRVTDARCRADGPCRGAEEFTPTNDIVLPRRGFFVRHVGREDTAADANAVLFFRRHEPYRVSHPVTGGDDCTSFTFAPEVLTAAFAAYDPAVHDRPDEPFPAARALLNTSAMLKLHQLRVAIHRLGQTPGALDALALDESALRLLDDIAAHGTPATTRRTNRRRSDTAHAHRRLTLDTLAVLSHGMSHPLTLPDIARQVHSSPFHLARVFHRCAGLSIHQYLVRLRLAAALQRLGEGEADLTRMALFLGFSSHAHFSDVFRREFGRPPRCVRQERLLHGLRETSKNLKA